MGALPSRGLTANGSRLLYQLIRATGEVASVTRRTVWSAATEAVLRISGEMAESHRSQYAGVRPPPSKVPVRTTVAEGDER